MNNKLLYLLCLIFALLGASNPSDRRVTKRNFREVVTVYSDQQDSEKGYKKIEKFDNNGDVVESWEWNSQGLLCQHIRYANSPVLERKIVYSASDSLVLVELTEFDSRGRKIHYYLNDKKKNRTEDQVIVYNKWGEKIREESRKNGKITSIKTYEYDKLGLLMVQKNSDSVGVLLSVKTYNYSK